MIEFGKTLREAREAKGYSVSQLAEITHILPQIIENLEKEDFTRIVAPIYGRGFVKLYCEAVGLEPQPLVAEFMEIYNGNRPPVIRLKETEPAIPEQADVLHPDPQPVVEESPVTAEETPPPEPVADEKPAAPEAPPTFNFDPLPEPPPPVRNPFARPTHESEPFKPGPDDLPFPEEKPETKRDYRLPGYSMPDVPRSFWRFGILLAAAAVILALIFFACRVLYHATMDAPESEAKTEQLPNADEAVQMPPVPKTETAARKSEALKAKLRIRTPRKPIAVPPLYID